MPHPSQMSFKDRMKKGDRRTPLLKAVTRAKMATDPPPNFCPFGCADHQLDDNGYCHHLIGFTDGKQFYEPRTENVGGPLGINTMGGRHKKLMQKGFVKVPISVSARVYSKKGNPKLAVVKTDEAAIDAKIAQAEREYEEKLEALRTPNLEGVYDGEYGTLPQEMNPGDYGFATGEDDDKE